MSYQKRKLPLTGGVTISTSNPNLDGTGTLGTILTSSNNGTLIESIIIKAVGNTTEGMVRLFIGTSAGGTKQLYKEVSIPQVTQSSVQPTFELVIDCGLVLDSGTEIYASTQWSETFNVVAIATTWINCDCATNCPTETKYEMNTGVVNINTSNPNLDGTGAISTVITATSGSGRGTRVTGLTVKGTGSTTEGMVRIFISFSGGGASMLISEVPIQGMTQTAVESACRYFYNPSIYLNPGDSLNASTENAESFNLIAEATDTISCDCPA